MTDLLESAAGELVLRVRGTNRNEQLLRLWSRKCTIGSGPRCTLRLKAKNVAPLHCLILRGEHGTVVRRWASDTRLNGQTFSDAELTPGDRLGIGSMEFEVVALNARGETTGTDSHNRLSKLSTPAQGDLQENEKREIDALRVSLNAEKAALDLRISQINQEVFALENEKECLKQEKISFLKERDDYLVSQNILLAARDAFVEKQKRLQTDREAFSEEQKTLQADREAFSEEQKALQADREAFQIEKEALLFEKNCLEVERQNWRIEQEELRIRQEAENAAKSAEQFNQFQLQREATTQVAEEFEESEKSEELSAQPRESKTPDNAPVDLQEILRRFGHKAEFSEDDTAERQSTSADSERAANRAKASTAQPEPTHEEDEESIDTYMEQLMQRLGIKQDEVGGAEANAEDATPSRPVHPNAPSETPAESAPRLENLWQRREPVKLLPRAAAEKNVDLSALRDLANLSAHSALGQHDFKQGLRMARSKLIVTVVALAACLVLLWQWQTHTTEKLVFASAVVSLLIALYWGIQYAIMTGRLTINRSGQIDMQKRREEPKSNDKEGKDSPHDDQCSLHPQGSANDAETT